jgi:hypothetical protein
MAPSCVDLIPGASQAFVLSDVKTRAAGQAGELPLILLGCDENDRDPPRRCDRGKDASNAKLFHCISLSPRQSYSPPAAGSFSGLSSPADE